MILAQINRWLHDKQDQHSVLLHMVLRPGRLNSLQIEVCWHVGGLSMVHRSLLPIEVLMAPGDEHELVNTTLNSIEASILKTLPKVAGDV